MMRQFEISVRELVEFILRSGDISSGYAGGVRANLRALEGTRLHQKLQKSEGGDYAKEVMMTETLLLKNDNGAPYAELTVEGRADGVFFFGGGMIDTELEFRRVSEEEALLDFKKGQIALEAEDLAKLDKERGYYEDDLIYLERGKLYRTVDEIKSTMTALKHITTETYPLHFAQAKCYALQLAKEEGLSEVLVRLTYVHVDSEKVKHLFRLYSLEELQEFYDGLIHAYSAWLKWQVKWDEERTASLNQLSFPFDKFRKGQRTMAAYVYKAIREKKRIFVQAPTGIGKTMSVLFPSLKAMGEGLNEKIFYLTAKNVAGEAAERAIALLKEKDLKLKTIRISAKDRICFLEKRKCNPQDCPYANGHFDRVNGAVLDSLESRDLFDMETIRRIAESFQVCPYELSLDIASWCDLIICDYNYAFDPSASLKRFFASGKHPYTLLGDEAHNLVDRARDMFSCELTKREFMDLKKTISKEDPAGKSLLRALSKINRLFLDMGKYVKELRPEEKNAWVRTGELRDQGKGLPEDLFYSRLDRLAEKMGEYFEALGRRGEEIPDENWEVYFRVLFFVRMLGEMGDGYECYLQQSDGTLRFRLFCVDPSDKLKDVYQNIGSAIFFSATLTPIDYYKQLLGAEAEDEAIALDSPFDPSRRKTMIAPIPVTYQARERSLDKVCELIYHSVRQREGHYMVFFPSYAYMDQVMDRLEKTYPDLNTLRQSSEMSEEERNAFLETFRTDPGALLGGCVLGGVFSEGIDLKGDSLIGAVIVTVGMPQLSLERDLIRNHFDRISENGFDYSYRYPGIGKVLQAVGRVIRTEEDQGMVLLIDRRFGEDRYLSLYPEDWFPIEEVSDGDEVKKAFEGFWQPLS